MTCGKLLWQRRVSARLSRARLARLSGLCEATIKLIEKDRTRPRRETLLRLLAVTELMLTPEDLGLESQAAPTTKQMRGAAVKPFVCALLFHRIHRRRNRRRITQKE